MDIYKFYNEIGWKKNKINSIDAQLFEDLRPCAKNYVSKCRKKIKKYIPKKGTNLLDFASGPIQYDEYLSYSKNFNKRHCVDFSKTAIKEARRKIKKKGKYYCKDFLKINFKKNFFDCVISLHTIYHINKKDQKKTVEKMIDITKKGKPIIIVYSNPNTLVSKIKNVLKFNNRNIKDKKLLYFYCHPLNWWKQFNDKASVEVFIWRSFSSQHQKIIFPDNYIGKLMFDLLFFFENKFSKFFSKNFQYPIILLTKK